MWLRGTGIGQLAAYPLSSCLLLDLESSGACPVVTFSTFCPLQKVHRACKNLFCYSMNLISFLEEVCEEDLKELADPGSPGKTAVKH